MIAERRMGPCGIQVGHRHSCSHTAIILVSPRGGSALRDRRTIACTVMCAVVSHLRVVSGREFPAARSSEGRGRGAMGSMDCAEFAIGIE